jgi:cytochrome b6-f complex iron-sulfur subunit
MAVPGSEQPNPSPSSDAAQPAPKTAVDATKYVGTPAVGTSKAAASAGLSSSGPSNTEVDRRRRRLVWVGVTAFLTAWFLAFFRFFLPRTLFEPNTVFKIGYPSEFTLGVDTKFQQKYRIWVDRTPDRLFVIYARCTHLGCTPDWKPAENKFKCPCHGSGYDSEGINFEGPAPYGSRETRIGARWSDHRRHLAALSVAEGATLAFQRSGGILDRRVNAGSAGVAAGSCGILRGNNG